MNSKTVASDELPTIAYNWLSQNGIIVNANYCKEAISTHPDYPALTSLTDFLESGGMEYDAVQADASYIHEFKYPLLAHIKQPGNEYLHLVNDVSVWDKEKSITENWSGIALYATKNTTWHNEENDAAEKLAQKNKYIAAAFIIAGLVLVIGSIFIYINVAINIFGLLSLAGLAISIAALGTELGYQSKLVKQVCGTVGNGGCEKVLGSKFANGFAGVTPADASVLYFAAQFTLYLIGCFYNPILSGIITISFASIAVVAWSVHAQAVKLKEWCALCLCIVAVLLGQIITASIQLQSLQYNTLYIPFLLFILTTILLIIIYLPIKQLIKTNSKNKQELASFKKWKTDASLFIAQWEKEPRCDNTIWGNDLLIGKLDAPLHIAVACNPYCEPCAKAHLELDKLVEKYPNKVSVKVRLLCEPKNEEDGRTIATKAILQQAAILKSNGELQTMLSDWFEWMDYEKWNVKWETKNNIDVSKVLQSHRNWIDETNISYTPTFFVNGRKLPSKYNIKDIEKMVLQLEDAFVEHVK
jgi:thiol-disulfide isomerase/thioredoxin